MNNGGKGSAPRPFSVDHNTFSNNWDAVFGKKKQTVEKPNCYCYNCLKDYIEPGQIFPYVTSRMIVCPECGNKRCPHATNHNLPCTNSNEPGQPGSRY
jgi:Zn finger protein HypA/HybF involved in hydrogenase expression